ncbi:MAG: hypothetical protein ACOCQM_00710 [Natronomonas sp.]
MAKFTFLEVHFTDSELSATKGYGSGEKEVSAADEPLEESSGSKKGGAIAAVVGLVFLVAVAYVVKTKILDDEESTFEFEDDVDEIDDIDT